MVTRSTLVGMVAVLLSAGACGGRHERELDGSGAGTSGGQGGAGTAAGARDAGPHATSGGSGAGAGQNSAGTSGGSTGTSGGSAGMSGGDGGSSGESAGAGAGGSGGSSSGECPVDAAWLACGRATQPSESVGALAESCTLLLDPPPDDPSLLNFAIDCEPQARDDPSAGWSIVDGTTIQLTPATCERVRSSGLERVDIYYGCRTLI